MKKYKIVSLIGLASLFTGLSSCTRNRNNDCSLSTQPSVSTPTSSEEVKEKTTDENSFEYKDNGDGTVSITNLKSRYYTNIVFPDTHDGKEVTYIDDSLDPHNYSWDCWLIDKYSRSNFIRNPNIKSVKYGKNIKEISPRIFLGSNNIEKIEVDKDNTNYYSENNCVIQKTEDDKDNKDLAFGVSTSIIPNDVTSIMSMAFSYCNFKSIRIPKSVTSISQDAFFMCSNLEKFEVDEGNPNYKFENGNLIENDKTLLFGTKNTSIPTETQLTSIGTCAFNGVTIDSLVIPSNIQIILSDEDTWLFMGSHIKKLTIGSFKIELSDYDEFRPFTNADIESINFENLTVVDKGNTYPGTATYDNKFLIINNTIVSYLGDEEVVTIPDNVTRIDWNAFYHDENVVAFGNSTIKEIKYSGSLIGFEQLFNNNVENFVNSIGWYDCGEEINYNCVLEKITYAGDEFPNTFSIDFKELVKNWDD